MCPKWKSFKSLEGSDQEEEQYKGSDEDTESEDEETSIGLLRAERTIGVPPRFFEEESSSSEDEQSDDNQQREALEGAIKKQLESHRAIEAEVDGARDDPEDPREGSGRFDPWHNSDRLTETVRNGFRAGHCPARSRRCLPPASRTLRWQRWPS